MRTLVAAACLWVVGCVPAGGNSGGDDTEDVGARGDSGPRPILLDGAAEAPDAADAELGGDDAADTDPRADQDGGGADMAAAAACSNGLDDDRDGRVDDDDPGCDGPDDDDETDPPPAGPACDDGLDNDDDGFFDVADPDCSSPADPTERGGNPVSACSNGLDDDEDGLIDFPEEPGCVAAGDETEEDPFTAAACGNGEDDDEDGHIDFPSDPGCQGRGDTLEDDPEPPPACGNGEDDDGNGEVDYPDDFGCESAADPTEGNPCGEGVDIVDLAAHLAGNEAYEGDLTDAPGVSVASCGGAAGGEQLFVWRVDRALDRLVFSTRHEETEAPVVMYLRRRCGGADLLCDRGAAGENGTALVVERPAIGTWFLAVDTGSRNRVGRFRLTVEEVESPQCRNGIDDDEDGRLDLADPGCVESEDDDEADPDEPPVCANGVDDDEDGFIDYPDDEDCEAAGADREAPLCALEVATIEVGQDGGEFELPVLPAGTPSRTQGTCEFGPSPEVLLVVTLDEPSEVEVEVFGPDGAPQAAGLYARPDCVVIQDELACLAAGQGGVLSLRGLERGVYYVFVEQGVVPPPVPRTARVSILSNLRECNDEIDNDADGLTDLADLGCTRGLDDDEGDDPAEPPACANGIDDNMDGDIDWPDDAGCEAAGDVDEQPPCAGMFFGGVCVNHVSPACQGGSALQYCAQADRGRIITHAEFLAIVAGGWVRPNGSYHTVTVAEYAMCAPEGIGNIGIPGWGDRHWNCGDVHDYCNRAIICVR